MVNRIEVGARSGGLNLQQAIILAEFGDTIVVLSEHDKQWGEELAYRRKPGVRIRFEVKNQ